MPGIRKQQQQILRNKCIKLSSNHKILCAGRLETTYQRTDLRLSDISNLLGEDWVPLASELGITTSDINLVKSECPSSVAQQAMVMLRLWLQHAGKKRQQKNKEVKTAATRDKRIWLDTLAESAQKAADTRNSQELYRITKNLAHKSFSQDGHQIKNKDGLILTSEVSQLARWTEYFSETLTAPTESPPNTNAPEEQPNELRINSKEPTIFEIKNAISKLKNGKSAGLDNLPPDLFKAYPNKIAKIILPLIQKAWKEESFPTEKKD
ncbi:hypothetical protein ANN_16388 [Periplaneta americana]|uniref:Death domain-containing protein n=1 Tax=Periplaneta americana TaxID=6978 RepID=A0ABQ8SIV3_PERAM|nr:hypothetical protein ANN_16388 [Periplaneta americana]